MSELFAFTVYLQRKYTEYEDSISLKETRIVPLVGDWQLNSESEHAVYKLPYLR